MRRHTATTATTSANPTRSNTQSYSTLSDPSHPTNIVIIVVHQILIYIPFINQFIIIITHLAVDAHSAIPSTDARFQFGTEFSWWSCEWLRSKESGRGCDTITTASLFIGKCEKSVSRVPSVICLYGIGVSHLVVLHRNGWIICLVSRTSSDR